jgi:hypothetical protein
MKCITLFIFNSYPSAFGYFFKNKQDKNNSKNKTMRGKGFEPSNLYRTRP